MTEEYSVWRSDIPKGQITLREAMESLGEHLKDPKHWDTPSYYHIPWILSPAEYDHLMMAVYKGLIPREWLP